MGGDFAMNPGRFGVGREDPSRSLGVSYGSFGPWAGAVMQGLGLAAAPMSPSGVLGLGLQGLTGKSLMGHAGGLLGFGGAMNPTAKSGLTPEEMMAGRAGGMGGGGLLDILGGGWSGGNMGGIDRGALG